MKSLKDTVLLLLIATLVWLLIAATFSGYYRHTEYTCLECRSKLLKNRYFGIPIHRTVLEPYSTTYLQTHPTHTHHWCWAGSEQTYTLLQEIRGCGRMHPIWFLPVDTHARYASLVTPEELTETLRVIDSPDSNAIFAKLEVISEIVMKSEGSAE